MFQKVSIPRRSLLATGMLLGLGAALATAPAQARSHVTAAFTVQLSPLYAGPSVEYPQVQRFTPQTQVNIMGCLPDFAWCDVMAGGARGWMDARRLSIVVNGNGRPLPAVAPSVGIPVTQFVMGPYWVAHYSDQPWFNDPRYAQALNSYRVRSRVGNTVIEYERSWQAQQPAYPPVYVEEAPVYVEPPVIYAPAPVYSPPPVYRPAPVYRGPSYYEPAFPDRSFEDRRFDNRRFEEESRYQPPRVNPLRPSPNFPQQEAPQVNPLRPSPNFPDAQRGGQPFPSADRAMPGPGAGQVITPNGRALK